MEQDIEKQPLIEGTSLDQQIKKLEHEICETLVKINLSTQGQISKILNGMLANSTTYASLSFLTPQLGNLNGVIASIMGALTNTATDIAVGYSKGINARESANRLLKILQGVALSEGVRGIGGLISNHATGFLIGMILSGLAESAWYNEAGKSGLARDYITKLNEQLHAYEQLTGFKLFQNSQSQAASTTPVYPPLNADYDHSLHQYFSLQPDSDNTTDLRKLEEEILVLLDKQGGLSIKKQAGKTAIGFALNSGTFISLTYLTPGLGIFNGVIASAVGSIMHLIVDRSTGNDRGSKIKSVIRTLDGIGVSQGTRSLLALVTEKHLTADFVLNIIVPPLMQSAWFNESSKRSTGDSDYIQLKQLMTKHAQIASELGEASPFAELQSSLKIL